MWWVWIFASQVRFARHPFLCHHCTMYHNHGLTPPVLVWSPGAPALSLGPVTPMGAIGPSLVCPKGLALSAPFQSMGGSRSNGTICYCSSPCCRRVQETILLLVLVALSNVCFCLVCQIDHCFRASTPGFWRRPKIFCCSWLASPSPFSVLL